MLREIREQVDKLSLPNRHDHWVPDPITGLKLTTSWTNPLLDLLRVAVYGSGGGYGRGGSEPDKRAVLNMDALDHMTSMHSGIQHLYDEAVGVASRRPTDEPKALLRRWLRLYSRQVTTGYLPVSEPQRQEQVYRRLLGWSTYIEALLDPPRTIELLVECASCERRYAYNPLGDRTSALVAQIWSGRESYISCRACGSAWSFTEYPMPTTV